MDLSPFSSGSKGANSDFSIKRILSEETRRNCDESVEVPNWLCCTRYCPPKVPRAVNSSNCRPRRSGRHARVPFTAAQAFALEAAYARAPYLAPPALRALAAALHLRDDRIKIWFQNRRARERREKCSIITPPHSVTLPPTTKSGAAGTTSWNPHISAEPPTQPQDYTIVSKQIESNILPEIRRNVTTPCSALSQKHNNNISSNNDVEMHLIETRPETPLDIETVDA